MANEVKREKTKNIKIGVIAILSTFVCSLFTLFPSGKSTKSTNIQSISEDISKIADSTVIESSLPYVVVESKNGKFDSPTNYAYMFRQLFSTEYTHFVATKNANKESKYNFDFAGDNLTFIYSDGEIIDNEFNDFYKHRYYNMELLYNSFPEYDKDVYKSCFITEDSAYQLLKERGISNPTRENLYSDLVFATNIEDRVVEVNTPDSIKKYVVTNIIIDEGNYSFYKDIKNTLGTFVFLCDDSLDDIDEPQQFCFMFDKYDYHNKFIYEYIVDNYANDNYTIKFGTNNLKEGIDVSHIINSMYKLEYNNVPYIINTVITFLLLSCYVFFVFFFKDTFKNKLLMMGLTLSSLLPYIVFKIVYLFTQNILLFSSITLITYFVAVAILFIATFLSLIIGVIKHEKQA